MAKFLPKKVWARTVLAVFAFLAIGFTAIIIFAPETPEKRFQNKLEKAVSLSPEEKKLVSDKLQELSKDSDQDGLKDWEEIIYRTDPNNADTDGDKTSDEDEIKQGRNPLVKGPGDKKEPKDSRTAGIAAEDDLENSLTRKFLGNITNAIAPFILQNRGDEISEKALLEAMAPSLKAIDPKNAIGDFIPVTKEDIVVSAKTDKASVKKYFNSVYGVYETTFVRLKEDSMTILMRAIQEQNFAELKKINATIEAFEKSFAEVKKIPVPKEYEGFAIKELNYLLASKKIVETFVRAESDPIALMLSVPKRIELVQEIRKFHQDTGLALAQKGIMFSPTEGGYILFQ